MWKKNSLSAGKTLSQEGEGKGEGEGKAQARAVCSSVAACSSGAAPRRKWGWPRMARACLAMTIPSTPLGAQLVE